MSTKLVNLFVILFCSISFVPLSSADCRKAKHDEVPHGANIFELMEPRTVPSIHGIILFPTGDALEDVVVEIFRYSGDGDYESIKEALVQRRIQACVTRQDGKFLFGGLKPGKYLLRAGTSYIHGMNEVHIILVLKPGAKEDKGGLHLTLTLGT